MASKEVKTETHSRAANWFAIACFLYPISFIAHKRFNDVVLMGLIVLACVLLWQPGNRRPLLKPGKGWLMALSLPLLLTLLQLAGGMGLESNDFNRPAQFLLGIPVYLAARQRHIAAKYFLQGCIGAAALASGLMLWSVAQYGGRGGIPDWHLALIPLTSFAIIFTAIAQQAAVAWDKPKLALFVSVMLWMAAIAAAVKSETRAAWALVVALAFAWLALNASLNKRHKRLILASMMIFFSAMYFALPAVQSRLQLAASEVAHYINGQKFETSSVGDRLELWRQAGTMLKHHPLLGIGEGRFGMQLKQAQDVGDAPAFMPPHVHPHNEFLLFATEHGIGGMIAFVLLYGVPLVVVLRRGKIIQYNQYNQYVIVILWMVGWIVAGLSDVVLFWKVTASFYAVATGLLLTLLEDEGTHQAKIKKQNTRAVLA